MKFRLVLYTPNELDAVVEDGCDRFSFIDKDSHGPMANFGINTQMEVGQKVAFITAPNAGLVTVERTS